MMINISPAGVETTQRFFLALRALKRQRKLRGIQTFTSRYGLNYWNTITLMREPERRILKTECLTYLVTDYGVSADWLLTGRGTMFADSSL